ncbi:hypothetical protein [Peptostreptococcus canis]|uniref:Uncharacterized protein n=1 Tax=Peptostreptococcus canis TaxID=1159213 RepID=A0ABR6TN20_9FIRM|nr:hypothetical protein [Peptostreptococcus canis]MBC2576817.1 hypothetical protein [Peptostreptococcus canis]MBP1998887.1 putative ATPase [Peptostreptococcus canis]
MIKITSANKNKNKKRPAVTFHDFVKNHKNDFVEVNSYLCSSKLYGTISEYDNLSLTLSVTYLDEENSKHGESLYIPLNSIKSIKKL